MGIDYSPYVANHPPWDALRFQQFEWQPFAIGLCYLIPLDLALSLWVFDLVWQGEYVLTSLLGWSLGRGTTGCPSATSRARAATSRCCSRPSGWTGTTSRTCCGGCWG